jgi:hypothetical protein
MTIDWLTKVITVDRTVDPFFTDVGNGYYEMDTNAFRLALKNVEDSEDGMVHDDTHRHNTAVSLGGVTFARTFEIINGYTVTFLPNSHWTARLTETNNNLADVKNVNEVSLIVQNSAGLAVAAAGEQMWQQPLEGTYTAEQMMRLMVAALAGKLTGADTGNIAIRDIADTKDRITATTTVEGNRLTVTLDPE